MNSKRTEDQNANEIFHHLFEQEYEGLIRYASAILRVRTKNAPVNGRAEVAVQEMFVLAWDRRDEVLSSKQPVGWLYKALYYKVLEVLKAENQWKKRLIRYRENYVPPVPEHISLNVNFDGLVPKKDFDLLCRMYIEGYSYAELCQELGLTKSELAVKIYRIKQKIREQLQD